MAKFWTDGELTKVEVLCSICYGIFVEPVSLPCKHTVCLECYRKHLEVTSLYCPICRYRLSVWSRKATRENKLVNLPFWERIKQQFPEEVAKRLAGLDTEPFLSPTDSPLKREGAMAHQGEIMNEFKTGLEQFEQELEIERRKEEEASTELIQKIQEEEPAPPPPQSPTELQADFELAKRLQEEEEKQERERQYQKQLRSSSGSSNSPGSSSNSRLSQGSSKSSKTKLNSSHKRGSPSSSKSLKTKKKSCLEGQPKISNFFPVSPTADSTAVATASTSTKSTDASSAAASLSGAPHNVDLNQATEVSFGVGVPGCSTSTSFLAALNGLTSHRNCSPGVQSRVSDSDESDNGALFEGSNLFLPGLIHDADTNSQDTDASSTVSIWEMVQREEMEYERQRILQEEEDRQYALQLQSFEKRGIGQGEYSLRPNSKRTKKSGGEE